MAIRKEDIARLSGSEDYTAYLLKARQRFEQGQAATVSDLRRVYRRAAEWVRKDIERLTPGTLRYSHLQALASALDQRARQLNSQVLEALQSGIRVAAGAGILGPQEIATSLLREAWTAAEVRWLFSGIHEQAVMMVLARAGKDGLKLSDRVWRTGEHYRQAITRLVEDGIARGLDSRKLARELQKYLQPGVWTAHKLETRRRLGVPKDVSYEAMRLARTEINNAFHEASIMANRATPGYKGVYWLLSGSHPAPDVCDKMAEETKYGEKGFYPAGLEPPKPHPQCFCYTVPKYESPEDFKERLKDWMRDPSSQPDLEAWYSSTGRRVLKRPGLTASLAASAAAAAGVVSMNLQLFAESSKERIERLVAEGKMPHAAVNRAEQVWEDRLKKGILAPNGEIVKTELDDLYHLIVDRRIWSHPERLEQMICGIYEIRTAREGRRLALTRWSEGEKIQVGYLILEADGRIKTAHVVDNRKIGRLQRQGELLWRK